MRTLAEAREQVADVILEHQAYRIGWGRGFLAATDLMGIDTDPVEALSTGQVTVHDPLLDAVAARRRDELAEAREYGTRALTAAQIASSVAYSHRLWERQIRERWQVAG